MTLNDFLKIRKATEKYEAITRSNGDYVELLRSPAFFNSWEKDVFASKLEGKNAKIQDLRRQLEEAGELNEDFK